MSPLALPPLDIRAFWGRIAAPTLGMAFFWAYFRYQFVFMVLYPPHTGAPLGPWSIPTHGAFLLTLTVLACTVLGLRQPVERTLRTRPGLWAALGAVGTLGSGLALWGLSATGDAHAALVWLSTPLVSCGFLTAFLGWGFVLSQGFSATQLVVLSASYLVSLVVFRPGTVLASELCPLMVPLGSGLLWLASARFSLRAAAPAEPATAVGHPLRNAPLWLFAAFLLAGSVVRGIVDLATVHPDPRRALSIPITGVLVAACAAYRIAMRHRGRDADPLPFVLGCWIGFAVLFFSGIFAFLVANDLSLGGSLVVIARSMLEVVLWMFLCDCASRHNAPVIPLFVVGGVFVETTSWAISYVAIPAVLPSSHGGAMSPQVLTLIAIFGLAAVITAMCGVLLVLQNSRHGGEKPAASPDASPAPADAPETKDARLSRLLETEHGLTAREATVALLYSRGYSLSKVAEGLGVTTSSAQTSIKNAYRKLDVHTRNELIAVVEGLREG